MTIITNSFTKDFEIRRHCLWQWTTLNSSTKSIVAWQHIINRSDEPITQTMLENSRNFVKVRVKSVLHNAMSDYH